MGEPRAYGVALCDILGFSEMVGRYPLKEFVERSLGWFRSVLHHSLHHGEFPRTPPSFDALNSHPLLGIAWFSDSILLWTREDNDDCFKALLETVGWLAFETITSLETKIRCGVAYGEAFIDPQESLFVGQAIVDAHRLEQAQQWSGGALTPSAEERTPEEVRRAKWWVAPYPVPVKAESTAISRMAVDWTQGFHHWAWELQWSKERADPSEEDRRLCPDVVEKFENTRAFHDALCSNCAVSRKQRHNR